MTSNSELTSNNLEFTQTELSILKRMRSEETYSEQELKMSDASGSIEALLNKKCISLSGYTGDNNAPMYTIAGLGIYYLRRFNAINIFDPLIDEQIFCTAREAFVLLDKYSEKAQARVVQLYKHRKTEGLATRDCTTNWLFTINSSQIPITRSTLIDPSTKLLRPLVIYQHTITAENDPAYISYLDVHGEQQFIDTDDINEVFILYPNEVYDDTKSTEA